MYLYIYIYTDRVFGWIRNPVQNWVPNPTKICPQGSVGIGTGLKCLYTSTKCIFGVHFGMFMWKSSYLRWPLFEAKNDEKKPKIERLQQRLACPAPTPSQNFSGPARKFSDEIPRVSPTVDFKAQPGAVPQNFPKLPQKFPKLPRSQPHLPLMTRKTSLWWKSGECLIPRMGLVRISRFACPTAFKRYNTSNPCWL